ncbi:mitotic-spindle organizing protein 2-like [Chrysemys picta bellii]|uniref:mitotic-spindle organizing protein 2-like n=1 Tax=Chrysemys picta bellii TaxID=8478 RepID=UPI0032B182D0
MSDQGLAGGGADSGLDAALGKVGASVRSRRKLPTAEEAELFELAQAAGIGLDPEVFRLLLDLLRMNVAPLAVFQMLKSLCAGQRPAPSGLAETAPETQGQELRVIRGPTPAGLVLGEPGPGSCPPPCREVPGLGPVAAAFCWGRGVIKGGMELSRQVPPA